MANKASKSLARTNAATLTRAHLITLALHVLFILYRLLFRGGSWKKYVLLTAPALVLEFYLERLGRPKYRPDGELRTPGEDMAAAGVTEYVWDVVYATWIVMGLVAVTGEWAWWIGAAVPIYGGYLAYSAYAGMKQGIMPGMPAPVAPPEETAGASKRQKKMEKRGGQKVQYR